jgi:hypothetical protein
MFGYIDGRFLHQITAGREFWRDLAGEDNKVKKQKLVLFLPA